MNLWLCLRLPQLALDALHHTQPEQFKAAQFADALPAAVVDARQVIIAGNAAAITAGIRLGMLNTTALAICPHLHCLSQNMQAEQTCLHSIASWAIQFSPRISLAPPCEVLIEIGGSLNLFGSMTGFQQTFQAALSQLHYQISTGIAPTPLGAQVLARSPTPEPALNLSELHQHLGLLNIEYMLWPTKIIQRIQAVGVKTLGECAALPRAGFIKRYGRETRRQLDQLWGHCDDPREAFTPTASFCSSLDLLSETENLDYLLPGFERLFHSLSLQLQGIGCGLLCIHISLAHGCAKPSRLSLQLQQASRDDKHWLELLRHRFERLELTEAVRAIQVRAGDFIELTHRQNALWPQAETGKINALMEQLTARLGSDALYSVSSDSSHCPEKAWHRVSAGQGQNVTTETRLRPLWLLPQAQAIAFQQLQDFSSVERLETNWWETPCQRDYYRARTSTGQHVWVYRDHAQAERWFLHGLFG